MRRLLLLLACAIGASAQNALPPGTLFAVRLERTVQASRLRVGDTVAATLIAPIIYRGAVLVPRDAHVVGHVLAAEVRKGHAPSRLLIRFDALRTAAAIATVNAFPVRQLVLRHTTTAAQGNNPCPSIARFNFQVQRRDRDPSSYPQTPHPDTLPCEGRIGSTTAMASNRTVLYSPPLKDMTLVHVANPPGASELVSHKKDIKLARGTILELRQESSGASEGSAQELHR